MKYGKRCATIYERAGGCECLKNPEKYPDKCKDPYSMTAEDVRVFIPDECMFMGVGDFHLSIKTYCNLREGKTVIQMNDKP